MNSSEAGAQPGNPRRLSKEEWYVFYIGVCLGLMEATNHFAEVNDFNRVRYGVWIVALGTNIALALWKITRTVAFPPDSWILPLYKTLFYFTAILCPYTSVSLLFPDKFALSLIVVISLIFLITTLYHFFDKLKLGLTWVSATLGMPSFIRPDQARAVAAAAADAAAAAPALPCCDAV